MRKKKLPAHEGGSGNIFADIGLPNAEEHLLKAALVVQLHRLIKARKLTQTAAAKIAGIKQPDLSNILRGHFQGFIAGAADADAHRVRPGHRDHRAPAPQEEARHWRDHVQRGRGVM